VLADESMIAAFQDRGGLPTLVTLRNGSSLVVHNIAWGYDEGHEWAHVTSNVSPAIDSAPVGFFYTSDVLRLNDPETGGLVFQG
jgi:hypothetical protein